MLNVTSYGPADGVPIVCLHGVTAHGRRWAKLAGGLPGFRLHGLDLRGHGHSNWNPPWDAVQHGDDILSTMDGLGLASSIVMGHSFGGLLTTHLLAREPQRFERAILLDPAIDVGVDHAREQAESQFSLEPWATLEEAVIARRDGRPDAAIADSDADTCIHAEAGPDGRFRLRYAPAAAVTAWSEMAGPPVDLSDCPVPVLLVGASGAPYVTEATRSWLRADLGELLTDVTVNSSHMVWWDGYHATVAAIREFLDGDT